MARKIKLINSEKEFTVDDEDYPLVAQFQWFEDCNGRIVAEVGGKTIPMSSQVIALMHKEAEVSRSLTRIGVV
jgi:hypothetical protein